MKVTYNWLKEFVDINIAAKELAERLTMSGLEVVSLEEKAGDFVFEIEVTSNRPDWLSVIGVAREVAAITNSKLKIKNSKTKIKNQKDAQLEIQIQDTKDCPLYTGKVVRKVKVASSPDWIKNRLELVGCRSVNNIVDITNYVLFEYGEPLHAFDLDRLESAQIIVRRAKGTEAITAIDGQPHRLRPDILVIADEKKPVAIAGVMGGKDTEVTSSTENVFLEAAVFNPALVRLGRRRLGLSSESSYRFERGVNPVAVEAASLRAVSLIQEIAQGECVLGISSGSVRAGNKKIILSAQGLEKALGFNISLSKARGILSRLGFAIKQKGKSSFLVTPPDWRSDISCTEDLIEEVGRIYGYGLIPATCPKILPELTPCPGRELVSEIKNILTGLGFNEAITYSLVDKDTLSYFCQVEKFKEVQVENPLSQEQEVLRTTVLVGLARAAAHNLNQKQEYVSLFEVAKIFYQDSTQAREELSLGVVLCGKKTGFLSRGFTKEEASIFHLKGAIQTIFERLAIKGYSLIEKQGQVEIMLGAKKLGQLFRLNKQVLDKLEIKNKDVFALELLLERLPKPSGHDKRFTPLPKFPGIVRDISFVLKDSLAIDEILDAIRQKNQPLLTEVKIIDYYQGQQIPQGFRGLTVSCLYRHSQRTLTEAEVNPLHAAACTILVERFGAKIR